MNLTYRGVTLGHSLHETDVEADDTWLSDLLLVLAEPEVMGSVASQVELVPVQVIVVHIYFFNN